MVSVIIVNWNSGPLLRRCLDALPAACGQHAVDVFVVDNASSDDSVARAQESRQPFRLIPLAENAGFARATNRALRQAMGEICLLLNPDTEPRSGSIAALAAAFANHPRAAVIGPRLLNTDGSPQPSVRRFPTLGVLVLVLTRVARLLPTLPALRRYAAEDVSLERDAPVDQVMGAAFAIRRRTLGEVGLLDERYWIWFEEVDFCRRVRRAGWEVWFAPASEVVHHQAAAFARVSPVRRAWWYGRSAVRYAAVHLGLPAATLVGLCLPFALLTALPAALASTPPGVRQQKAA